MSHHGNDLEERFQWREGMDPDHIFDEEREMIGKIREEIPELKDESDKFVVVFLFYTRHDVTATTARLKVFYERKAELLRTALGGIQVPSFKYTPHLQNYSIENDAPLIHPKGYRDVHGRMVRMVSMPRTNTHPTPEQIQQILAFQFWQVYYIVATEPLNAWRNGILMVMDLKKMGLRHLSASKSETGKMMREILPFRIRSILGINAGKFVTVIIAALRAVIPKMVERLRLIDKKDVGEYVSLEYIAPHFGGNANFFYKEYADEVKRVEDELFATGVWKVPALDGASS